MTAEERQAALRANKALLKGVTKKSGITVNGKHYSKEEWQGKVQYNSYKIWYQYNTERHEMKGMLRESEFRNVLKATKKAYSDKKSTLAYNAPRELANNSRRVTARQERASKEAIKNITEQYGIKPLKEYIGKRGRGVSESDWTKHTEKAKRDWVEEIMTKQDSLKGKPDIAAALLMNPTEFAKKFYSDKAFGREFAQAFGKRRQMKNRRTGETYEGYDLSDWFDSP